ncbi:MAG: type I-U CRISPR-associated RAMP protein Csb1/Cas7u [Vicinamibacterales bacterium]
MEDRTQLTLTPGTLRSLVEGDAVAIRGTATLEPAGGTLDKVFPPTHSVDKNDRQPGAKYAFEKRRVGGQDVTCVLLDSVQSQANRMEEALEALWVSRQIALPVIQTDFTDCAPDVGVVTSLSAPHRVADAILRDSLKDGTLFRLSDVGRSFTDASTKNAGPVFKVCPTGLVFGLWDSTGPRGGLGAKFARALVSEIVGIGATTGVKTSSRLDPTGIVTRAADVYVAADPREGWTHDPQQARHEEGRPVRKGDGKVSEVNHSNVPPTIDVLAGGVTIDKAEQIVVLSLAGLRKLAFSEGAAEARAVLAALALVAILAAERRGYDLRSRCLLVPRRGKALAFEVVYRDGETKALEVDLEAALSTYHAAVAALPASLRFSVDGRPLEAGEPIARLTPSPKLAHLVQKSRELAAVGEAIEEA